MVAEMAWFWSALYAMALYDITPLGSKVTVVAHEEAAAAGPSFTAALLTHLGLAPPVVKNLEPRASEVDVGALHNLNRNPADVAREWEKRVSVDDRRELDERTSIVRAALWNRAFHSVGRAGEVDQ